MAAIPVEGRVCDSPAVAKVRMVCARVEAHRVTALVCGLHEANLTTTSYCRSCYDLLHDGVHLRVAEKTALVPAPRRLILPEQRRS